MRLTLSRGVPGQGPRLVITAREVDPVPAEGVKVRVSELRLLGGDPLMELKTTSRLRYVLAREEVRARGAWEALLVNAAGDLAEGTVSNLFLVAGRRLRTPSRDSGCLGGIVRERILADLERAPLDGVTLEVGRVPASALADADELFLTNTTGGVVPVSELLGPEPRRFAGPAGPVTRAVQARYGALQAADRPGR